MGASKEEADQVELAGTVETSTEAKTIISSAWRAYTICACRFAPLTELQTVCLSCLSMTAPFLPALTHLAGAQ